MNTIVESDSSAPAIIVDCLEYSKPSRERFLEWQRGRVGCVHVTLAVWETARETLSVIGQWNDLFAENADLVALARTSAEIRTIAASGRTAVVFGFQNTAPLEDDIRLVQVFHDLGVRIVQLTYNTQNSIAAGCWEDADSGLSTHVGRQFVDELNRVGMLIDLSHCSERTCLDTIALSSAPVAVTHANPLEFVGSDVELGRRPKSTAVLEALTERGGVVGLSPYVRMLKHGIRTTEQEFVDMISWTVDKFGVEHVALGTDFYTGYGIEAVKWWRMGRWARESPVPIDEQAPVVQWPAWFSSPEAFPSLVSTMEKSGFSATELDRVLGGNWIRLFGEIFDRPQQ
ncbi:membrane dipeptidase [Leucobacter chromiireducens]|uniref:Dipeptidase n=1 Tax=Leucobacter chromiireducens subsp. solipictus TaxID=398235 RepID=A0ABS1SFU7_9MICO|nr:membrane dipeptidase [Leucobacter chromiireducens]MBL3678917.1 dipeptidase [Leucobacter chromiireducens subsp. solipictus]